jgi:hypothetical protein
VGRGSGAVSDLLQLGDFQGNYHYGDLQLGDFQGNYHYGDHEGVSPWGTPDHSPMPSPRRTQVHVWFGPTEQTLP